MEVLGVLALIDGYDSNTIIHSPVDINQMMESKCYKRASYQGQPKYVNW